MEECPSPDAWFSLGEDASLDHHLDRCEPCRKLVAVLARGSVLGTAPAASRDHVGLIPELVPAGTELGRFVVRGAVGVGGMGVVLEAFDPKLERTVALKVVRKLGDERAWRSERDRVFAEGKAMARLSHPNVVAIHDLIEVGDEHLIAMEFVAGPDLETWLAGKPAWRDRLHVVVGLGRGLVAAHAAGVIHRDIKPTNVLIADGTARVTDFGLAALTGTATRGALGTLAYAAPETRDGRNDALSDQYSFAVTAWRTLFDAWPSEGPRRGRIARVLRRAMSRAPDDRYPTMRAALHALERAARPPRFAIAGGVALLGAAAVVAGVLAVGDRGQAACALDSSVDAVWSDAIRAKWSASLGAKLHGDAARVTANLDIAWAAWQAATAHACSASDLGVVACLAAQRRQLATFTQNAALSTDLATVESALKDIQHLDCTTAPRARPTSLPPAERPVHDELVAELDEITMLFWLAEYAPALARLDVVAARIPAQDDQLRGQVLYRRAELFSRVGEMQKSLEMFEQALAIATRIADADMRMNAMIELLLDYDELGDLAKANALIPAAEALARTLPFEPYRAGRLASALGSIASESGRYAEAERHYRQFVTLREQDARATGGNSLGLAGALHNLGLVVHAQGRLDEAIALQTRARTMFDLTVGPAHPNAALPVAELASLALEQGRADEAFELYARAIATLEHALGADNPQLAEPLSGRALAEVRRGAYDPALADYRRAIDLATKAGPDNPVLAETQYRLALELERRGQDAEASALEEACVHGWETTKIDTPDAYHARFVLARRLWDRGGDRARATALATAARDGLATHDARYAADVAEVTAWLASHR